MHKPIKKRIPFRKRPKPLGIKKFGAPGTPAKANEPVPVSPELKAAFDALPERKTPRTIPPSTKRAVLFGGPTVRKFCIVASALFLMLGLPTIALISGPPLGFTVVLVGLFAFIFFTLLVVGVILEVRRRLDYLKTLSFWPLSVAEVTSVESRIVPQKNGETIENYAVSFTYLDTAGDAHSDQVILQHDSGIDEGTIERILFNPALKDVVFEDQIEASVRIGDDGEVHSNARDVGLNLLLLGVTFAWTVAAAIGVSIGMSSLDYEDNEPNPIVQGEIDRLKGEKEETPFQKEMRLEAEFREKLKRLKERGTEVTCYGADRADELVVRMDGRNVTIRLIGVKAAEVDSAGFKLNIRVDNRRVVIVEDSGLQSDPGEPRLYYAFLDDELLNLWVLKETNATYNPDTASGSELERELRDAAGIDD